HLDQIHVALPRQIERLLDRQDAELLAVRAHDPDLPNANPLVDADVLRRDRCRSSGAGPAQAERPTVRGADRLPISAASSASTRSTGRAPASSPLRRLTLAVPFCASRSPTTSMYGTFRSWASRIR